MKDDGQATDRIGDDPTGHTYVIAQAGALADLIRQAHGRALTRSETHAVRELTSALQALIGAEGDEA